MYLDPSESEVRKIVAKRERPEFVETKKTEEQYEKDIKALPLESKGLHDRICEMMEQIGFYMGYNAHTRYKLAPRCELDVTWHHGKNPEFAMEVQIGGNMREAVHRLSQARKFNYRKVFMMLLEKDLSELNKIMAHEPELRIWMEAWSIGAVYEMYVSGEKFFNHYQQLNNSRKQVGSSLRLLEYV